MKIWIDILTPKQLLFVEPIVERLGKKHKILCTSRDYGEVSKLAEIRRFKLTFVGRYGGNSNSGKLKSSVSRMAEMTQKVITFSPDVVISSCSPEAARIAFGLGIRHIAFSDSPHMEAIMRLTIPLIQKLLTPAVIPKKEFVKFGINKDDIVPYKAIDASVTIRRKTFREKATPFANNKKKNILIRVDEEEASYVSKTGMAIPMVKKMVDEFGGENIVILGRYAKQVKNLQKVVGRKAKVVRMSFDGKSLLEKADIFIGSGGTMTAESALIGVPTISYDAVPNIIQDYLVKRGLIRLETDPSKISKHVKKVLADSGEKYQKRASRVLSGMEDPVAKLVEVIES